MFAGVREIEDPLSEVIRLLRPRAVVSKGISGAGTWAVRYAAMGSPAFCGMIEGRCRLLVEGEAPVVLEAGDFVLLPETPAITMTSMDAAAPFAALEAPAAPVSALPVAERRHGRPDGPADMRQFGGYFSFAAPDAALLVSLLPRMILVRDVPRLAQLVALIGEEAQRDEFGRALVLERLVEVLLIEALRAVPARTAAPGLARGLADARIAVALRSVHEDPARAWTVATLAHEAALSRSAFFDRFVRTVGVRPMAYVLGWRMAVAKDLLRTGRLPLDEVARRSGYGSAGTFSTAFRRHVGVAPGRFQREGAVAAASVKRWSPTPGTLC